MPRRPAPVASPSSNRGQRGSSRANPPKRVSLGTTTINAFSLLLDGSACCICLKMNVVILRFGEEIPGMEGLGTGMYNFESKIIIKYYILKSLETLRLCACVITFSLTDFNVICPWEAYSHLELHELAQYGII